MFGIILKMCACLVVFILLWNMFNSKLNMLIKYVLICIGVVILFGLFQFIDINTLDYKTEQKLNKVTEVVGDTYITVQGNDILIRIKGKWVNLEDVKIIGGLLTDKIILDYDGEEIYLGETGIVNTVKTLNKFGLIDSEK